MRLFNLFEIMREPVAREIRPADHNPFSINEDPANKIIEGSPLFNTSAICSITLGLTVAAFWICGTVAGSVLLLQEQSAGKIKVATWPGGFCEAAMASAASLGTLGPSLHVFTQPETVLEIDSMSVVSGASCFK